jgi:hypothetical protein
MPRFILNCLFLLYYLVIFNFYIGEGFRKYNLIHHRILQNYERQK